MSLRLKIISLFIPLLLVFGGPQSILAAPAFSDATISSVTATVTSDHNQEKLNVIITGTVKSVSYVSVVSALLDPSSDAQLYGAQSCQNSRVKIVPSQFSVKLICPVQRGFIFSRAGFRIDIFPLATGGVVYHTETKNVTVAGTSSGSAKDNPTAAPGRCGDDKSGFIDGLFCDTLFGKQIGASEYFRRLYFWLVGMAILGAATAIVVAGYKYVISRGNPTEITSAKEIITSAVVGLALLLLSFTILRFLGVNVG